MLRNQLTGLHRSLRALSRVVARGGLKDAGKIERRLGWLEERYPQGWSMLSAVEHRRGRLLWLKFPRFGGQGRRRYRRKNCKHAFNPSHL